MSTKTPNPSVKVREVAEHNRQRKDIQGMRALAVLTVVAAHAGADWLPGGYVGVDVFFVISGFLITGILVKGAQRDGRIDFIDFFARRARRILPAATVTVVATMIASTLILNYVRARDVLLDGIWSTLCLANFRFTSVGTDYFAQSQPPSPLQHFWSLAVEEQFYFVWPALLAVLMWKPLSRVKAKGSSGVPRVALVGIATVTVLSLAYSIYFSTENATAAYFSPFTRTWELGVGATLAIAAPALSRLPRYVRLCLGWAGLVAIAAACLFYTEETTFPGYAALLPVLGAGAILVAGLVETRGGVESVIGVGPLRFVGDISYSLYLWHWPVLILAEQYHGKELPADARVALVGAAFALSVASYYLIESPVRDTAILGGKSDLHQTHRAAPLVIWPLVIFMTFATGIWGQSQIREAEGALVEAANPARVEEAQEADETAVAAGIEGVVGAAVEAAIAEEPLPDALQPPIAKLLPPADTLGGCQTKALEASSDVCPMGKTGAPTRVVVFGNSHTRAWLPAFKTMAATEKFEYVPVLKAGCHPENLTGQVVQEKCADWYTWAKDQIAKLKPDVLFYEPSYTEHSTTATLQVIRELREVALGRFVVMADVPGQETEPVDCLLQNDVTLASCMGSVRVAYTQMNSTIAAEASRLGAEFIDITKWFCNSDRCPLIVGHTIVYFDSSHVTAEYVDLLTPTLRDALAISNA